MMNHELRALVRCPNCNKLLRDAGIVQLHVGGIRVRFLGEKARLKGQWVQWGDTSYFCGTCEHELDEVYKFSDKLAIEYAHLGDTDAYEQEMQDTLKQILSWEE